MHEKRIARGAAWLDTEEPDWYLRIRVESLNSISHHGCVLGQAFGDFSAYMCDRYFIPRHWERRMFAHPGFYVAHTFAARHGFIRLTETEDQWRRAWAAEILKRKTIALAEKPIYVPAEWSARSRELEEHLLRG